MATLEFACGTYLSLICRGERLLQSISLALILIYFYLLKVMERCIKLGAYCCSQSIFYMLLEIILDQGCNSYAK